MKSLKLAAIIENLDQFISFVHICSEEYGFEGKRAMEIELAVEEGLVNIFNYAYPCPLPVKNSWTKLFA